MEQRDKNLMGVFSHFERNRYFFSYLFIAAYLFINNTINASSVWMEKNRDGSPEIQRWEPFVWEYTSAISTLILLPIIFELFRRFPLRFDNLARQLIVHLLATISFSAAHVGLMVAMRELAYSFNDGNYSFSPWLQEFWYEYRKDAWGYLFWLIIYHMVRMLYGRLKGEASLVEDADGSQTLSRKSDPPDYLLVKKLDKEFLVKVCEIEWLESAGNYVNLHKGGRIYPMRGTLAGTVEKLMSRGFSRIHRSFAVNHDAIESIQYQPSGDGIARLKSGVELAVSRRYKSDLKRLFEEL